MKHHIRRIIPVIILLTLGTISILYLRSLNQADQGPLQASGSIEAVMITLAPEMSGRVIEVLAAEGETVTTGQVLVRLDDSLLQAQLAQAEAALETAQANLDLVASGKTSEQTNAGIAAATLELTAATQARQALFDQHAVAKAQSALAVTAAEKAIQDAETALENAMALSYQPQLDAANAAVILAKDKLDQAQENYDANDDREADDPLLAAAAAQLAQAQIAYDAAVQQARTLEGKNNSQEVALAEAALTVAEVQLSTAEKTAADLADGPDPDTLALLDARVANAEAQLALANAPAPTPEQLAVAQAQVKAAETNVSTLKVQLAKTVVTAPDSGLVMDRLVEPGEMALPNAPIIILAKVQELHITIYIPEDRYGEIQIGQSAQVLVDSFPGQSFNAKVTFIANQAEFTPRNVQTVEGRKATVFAVELSIDSSNGKLKPGMPADVVFSEGN